MNNTNTVVQCNVCNALMLSHVYRYLPTSRHHAWACAAGSKGYCATKEMLQNGIPGHTLLIESRDLRDVEDSSGDEDVQVMCVIYNFPSHPHVAFSYKDHIPTTASHVTIFSNSVSLPQKLLMNATAITSIDLSPLSQVREIQEDFLHGCTTLKSLDLSPLSGVMVVQRSFLRWCTALTILDLSPLSHLTTLHEGFLDRCKGLTELDLTPLRQIREIPRYFLTECIGLSALDLSPLGNVLEVHEGFLEGCSGLRALDVSPLSQLTVLHEYFLSRCTGLHELDLSPLSHLQEIHVGVMYECTGLSSLRFAPPPCGIQVKRDLFLHSCTGILSVINPPSRHNPPPDLLEVTTTTASGTTELHWARRSLKEDNRKGVMQCAVDEASKCVVQ